MMMYSSMGFAIFYLILVILPAPGIASGLVCHSCAGKAWCKDNIPRESGTCRVGKYGKCFVRTDPNGEMYWGCATKRDWPALRLRENGCRDYDEMGWGGKPATWCLCDFNHCNIDVNSIRGHYATKRTTPSLTVTSMGTRRPRRFYNHNARSHGFRVKGSGENQPSRRTPNRKPIHIGFLVTAPQFENTVLDDIEVDSLQPVSTQAMYLTENDARQFKLPSSEVGQEMSTTSKKPLESEDTKVLRDCRFDRGGCDHQCVHGQNTWYGHCICESGYQLDQDGTTCTDLDECASLIGRCEQTCENVPGSYKCGCREGYIMDGYGQCQELDECSSPKNPCSHQCKNVAGSFECLCPHGYQLSDDQHTCKDVNECLAGLAMCEQLCENTLGSFSCQCQQGFRINTDGWSCDDINECDVNNGGCEHTCINARGSYICACDSGFTLSEDGTTCEDVNECSENEGLCSQVCYNEWGGYQCVCYPGYQLDPDQITCHEIPGVRTCFRDNGGCEHKCHMTSASAYDTYCACEEGFQLDVDQVSCLDIDECELGTAECSHECVNTRGNFTCLCEEGYELAQNLRTCVDLDECASAHHKCEQRCENTDGSYVCTCLTGFMLTNDSSTCQDVDECLLNNGGCTDVCVNIPGSYSCRCLHGYAINGDHHSCNDVNECLVDNGSCAHECINTDGSHVCQCVDGFMLDDDNRSCVDYNECEYENGGCEQSCINIFGSRKCICKDGYHLHTDGRTCQDIDECASGTFFCEDTCVNTNGSYNCSCRPGYQVDTDGVSCVDENECLSDNGGCQQNCINLEGSHQCVCRELYTLADDDRGCLASCPVGFRKADGISSCFRIHSDPHGARTYTEAEAYCRRIDAHAHLARIDSVDKRLYLAGLLSSVTPLFDGWEGWWIGGRYLERISQFVWADTLAEISLHHRNWGIQRRPFEGTCIWLMQSTSYAYMFENANCSIPAGSVCEIILPS